MEETHVRLFLLLLSHSSPRQASSFTLLNPVKHSFYFCGHSSCYVLPLLILTVWCWAFQRTTSGLSTESLHEHLRNKKGGDVGSRGRPKWIVCFLTWARPCQGPQCLRSMDMAKPFPGQAQGQSLPLVQARMLTVCAESVNCSFLLPTAASFSQLQPPPPSCSFFLHLQLLPPGCLKPRLFPYRDPPKD